MGFFHIYGINPKLPFKIISALAFPLKAIMSSVGGWMCLFYKEKKDNR